MNGLELRQYHVGRGHRGERQAFDNPAMVTASGPQSVTGRMGPDPSKLAEDFAYFREGEGTAYARTVLVTDGGDFVAAGQQKGWHVLWSWGQPGWDMLRFPYTIIMYRGEIYKKGDDAAGPFVFVQHTEGDLDMYSFGSNALRREALTYVFVWDAVARGESWAEGWDPEDSSTWPAEVYGPYGWMDAAVPA